MHIDETINNSHLTQKQFGMSTSQVVAIVIITDVLILLLTIGT